MRFEINPEIGYIKLEAENVHSIEVVEELIMAFKGVLIAAGHEYLQDYNLELTPRNDNKDTSDGTRWQAVSIT